MYDYDKSPMNDLLRLQHECWDVTGTTSWESEAMENAIEYWSAQYPDDAPPVIPESASDTIRDKVQFVIDCIEQRVVSAEPHS